jgi:hypothetical protein
LRRRETLVFDQETGVGRRRRKKKKKAEKVGGGWLTEFMICRCGSVMGNLMGDYIYFLGRLISDDLSI